MRTLLVIDDEELLRKMYERILEKLGFSVFAALKKGVSSKCLTP